MHRTFKSRARAALAGLIGLCVLGLADIRPLAAQSPAPAWADPELVRAARAEGGTLTVYSSVNEQEARQRSLDLLLSPAVGRLPRDFMQPLDLSEAPNLMPQARDPDRRWYGVYANYDVPSYNSKLVNRADLPKSYEDFLAHKEWVGRIAVEQTDVQWLSALFTHYGEE